MKNKIYLMKVDEHVVIGFAKCANWGCGSAVLDTQNMSKKEIERCMRYRFLQQAARLRREEGREVSFTGADVEWLEFDNVISTQKQQTFEQEVTVQKPKNWYIEEIHGLYIPKQLTQRLYDEDGCLKEIGRLYGMMARKSE